MVPKKVQHKVGLVVPFVMPLLCFSIDGRCGMEDNAVKRIPPDEAVELLRKDGIEVTEEQAKVILEFLYEMADIVVAQYLSNPV
jgi:hypothetical protein